METCTLAAEPIKRYREEDLVLSHVAEAIVILHETHLDCRTIEKVEFSFDLMHVKGNRAGY